MKIKKYILNAIVCLALVSGMTSCGDSFFDTENYSGVDLDNGLNSVENIGTALNGTYYRLYYYPFAGNYALNIGDIPTDITYWNGLTNHFNNIYSFTFTDTESYLKYIWQYGYKVADNAARVIQGSQALYEGASAEEQSTLNLYMAEAYAMRGYAQLLLTNIYCHQVKVNGTDYSSQPGIVVIDEPIAALTEVSRSTVGESYDAIVSDFKNALTRFDAAGGDRGDLNYFGKAATCGLLARAYMYLEDWSNAKTYAAQALSESGVTISAYSKEAYKALYNSASSNSESMFALAITSTQNWSANSCGTLWSTYNFSPSPKLMAMYGANDCRRVLVDSRDATNSTETAPVYTGGKFSHFSSGNPAYGTNYIVNAPEMYLIEAEADLQQNNLDAAKSELLVVAKRDADITSVNDLPSTKAELYSFLKDERARELFQEGFRLWDLRRWGEKASVYAYNAPDIQFTYNNYDISNLIFPIPADEINSGFGVEQNDWSGTLPK